MTRRPRVSVVIITKDEARIANMVDFERVVRLGNEEMYDRVRRAHPALQVLE